MHTSRAFLLLLAALPLTACAGARGVPSGPSAAPSANVYLRNAFDTDPSIYLGRFVPRGAADLDEGSAMPLACTQHVSFRFIEGGGVKLTETMSVSTEVAARLGVPVVASAQGSGSRTGEVKVEYTLTGKMVADVRDPAAFNECCKAQPDQCTDRFIGEFLQGTGTVFRQEAREVDVGAKGTDPSSGVSGSAAVSHGKQWAQAIEFPNPVYFAFKVTQTPSTRTVSSCGSWVERPPTEPGFVYFVGTSGTKRNERAAREWATVMAQEKAFQSVAKPEALTTHDGSVDTNINDEQRLWAQGMQVVESCVETVSGRRKRKYVGRVLGKLPVFQAGASDGGPQPSDAADVPEPEPDDELEPVEPVEAELPGEPGEPSEAEVGEDVFDEPF